jgi:hypothetical protein
MDNRNGQVEPRQPLVTITALLYAASGIPYTLGNLPILVHLLRYRTLPVIAGIPFYRGSFIANQGINWVIASTAIFVLLGVLSIAVAALLWNSRRAGALLALAMFPIIAAISIGGEAPIPLCLEPLKVVLIVLSWNSLR